MSRHKHKAIPSRTTTTGYRGGIWPTEDGAQNPAAAGGVRHEETCRCGATRAINSNGRHVETGIWQEPDIDDDAKPSPVELARADMDV